MASLATALKQAGLGLGAFGIGCFGLGMRAMPAQAATLPATLSAIGPGVLRSTADTLPLAKPANPSADQLADQGVEAFTQGDRTAAFDYWQQAMLLYREGGRSHPKQPVCSKILALSTG